MSRILLFSDRNGIFGAEQIDHRLALGFLAAGWRVSMAQPTADNALIDERRRHGIPHYWLPVEDIYHWHEPAPSLSDPAPAEDCFAAARPDLILFADSFPLANLAAKQAAARLGIPFVVLVHCVQPAWAEQYAACLPRLPAVYAAAREVVAVSTENLDLLRRYFGLAQGRGRVILNGRPDIFFQPRDAAERRRVRAELGIPDDHLLVLTIGRYETVKGYDLFLDALDLLRRRPHWQRLAFAWVGSGTMDDVLRWIGWMLGRGRVRLLGERGDIPALLDAADLLAHPARFEGMPLVILEAMAKGLPIIASGVSGIPEALAETGLLLPAPDETADFPRQLAEAINALADDAERRHALGAAARERAFAHFTQARMIDDWNALIRRMAALS
ncbi:glycosyltransferase family 4 protein [Methylomagnum sp.]